MSGVLPAERLLSVNSTEELAELTELRDRGITTIERVNTLARERSRSQSDVLQGEILRAQSAAALSELDERIFNLRDGFRKQTQQELADALLYDVTLGTAIDSQIEIIDITGAEPPNVQADGTGYVIERFQDGTASPEPVDLLTVLAPDDVLYVSREPPRTN